jgi:hypothetical protein
MLEGAPLDEANGGRITLTMTRRAAQQNRPVSRLGDPCHHLPEHVIENFSPTGG